MDRPRKRLRPSERNLPPNARALVINADTRARRPSVSLAITPLSLLSLRRATTRLLRGLAFLAGSGSGSCARAARAASCARGRVASCARGRTRRARSAATARLRAHEALQELGPYPRDVASAHGDDHVARLNALCQYIDQLAHIG